LPGLGLVYLSVGRTGRPPAHRPCPPRRRRDRRRPPLQSTDTDISMPWPHHIPTAPPLHVSTSRLHARGPHAGRWICRRGSEQVAALCCVESTAFRLGLGLGLGLKDVNDSLLVVSAIHSSASAAWSFETVGPQIPVLLFVVTFGSTMDSRHGCKAGVHSTKSRSMGAILINTTDKQTTA